jgi:hypothetical protein
MNWIEPKTNWNAQDFFNINDYNRIINNVHCLKVLAVEILEGHNTPSNEIVEKNYTSMIYASEINAIENDIDAFNETTYRLGIGDKKTYYPNEKTMDYIELNRIESACLILYNTLVAHKTALPSLEFTLGGQKGIDV